MSARDPGGACGFTHVQSLDVDTISELETARSFVASADSGHVYLTGDNGVAVLERDAATGELTEVGFKSVFEREGFYIYWWESDATLAPLSKNHLFVIREDSPRSRFTASPILRTLS